MCVRTLPVFHNGSVALIQVAASRSFFYNWLFCGSSGGAHAVILVLMQKSFVTRCVESLITEHDKVPVAFFHVPHVHKVRS
jgi:hypothetical protein